MKLVVVDVDLTVVDTLTPWITWWEKQCRKKFDWNKVSKDFSINDQLVTGMKLEDYMKYWDREDLYDDLEPIEGSVKALKLLKDMGYDIFFVSNCIDGHVKSKLRFLDKYFPFHDGLVSTANKHMIKAEIYFDDHVEYIDNIVEHRPNAKVYQFVTRDNEYQLNPKAIPIKTWGEFDELHFARS